MVADALSGRVLLEPKALKLSINNQRYRQRQVVGFPPRNVVHAR